MKSHFRVDSMYTKQLVITKNNSEMQSAMLQVKSDFTDI